MIKTFKYSNATIKVATNMMKSGKSYFGEKDILAEFENIHKLVTYGKSRETTTETFLIDIVNMFKARGIAVKEVSIGDLTYKGTKMTDLDRQTTLVKEEPLANPLVDKDIQVVMKERLNKDATKNVKRN